MRVLFREEIKLNKNIRKFHKIIDCKGTLSFIIGSELKNVGKKGMLSCRADQERLNLCPVRQISEKGGFS